MDNDAVMVNPPLIISTLVICRHQFERDLIISWRLNSTWFSEVVITFITRNLDNEVEVLYRQKKS